VTDTDTGSSEEESAEQTPVAAPTGSWAGLFGPLALVTIVLSIIAVIVAVNAGGSTRTDSASGGGSAASSLEADLSEFAFSFSSSTILAGSDVSVSLTNVGLVEHNFAVLREGANPAGEANISDAMVIADLGTISRSESGTGSLNLPAATYLVVCLVPGHFDAGMSAELTAGS
jgi:uncharacterized cupredoxin-like copper-binding protein